MGTARIMSDLKDLFERRLNHYSHITNLILDSIPNVTEGVLQALSEDESSTLEWEDAQFEPEEKLLTLIGAIRLDLGERVQLEDGRELHITEDNVEVFKRIIRVGLPFDLVENGSVDDIVDFFADKKQMNYTTISDLSEELLDDLPLHELDEITEEDMHNVERALSTIIGFNTDDLSDEQIRQILYNIDEGNIH